ncbi:fibronectin type III domain-containing protein [Paenibacillus whitsoniae]|uniref:fibronectin type III domain-containing protein n=1 Tax=Paenibacillus whitsoniae TaxID=2496558 RepID=UPI00269F8911
MKNINQMPIDLMVAPATLATDSLTLVWDKPLDYANIIGYAVFQDEVRIAITKPNQTHFSLRGLSEDTIYQFRIQAVSAYDNPSTPNLTVRTKPACTIIDVTKSPYCADASGESISTITVQKAIDDCPAGGTVFIPKGAIVLTGTLELKSEMTLHVDGMLKGSLDPNDYIVPKERRQSYKGMVNEDGLILTRYEGWEMYCYRSLINAGHLNPENRLIETCENIRICGDGTIYGGGNELGTAMKQLYADKEKYPEYVSDGMGGETHTRSTAWFYPVQERTPYRYQY